MTNAGGSSLTWDDNGQLTTGLTTTFTWNWEGKLRTAASGSNSIHVKYDPMGNRVWKQTSDGQNTTARKYIVDISGNLPTILCEIDTADGSLKKSYYYADGQILAQKDYADPANVHKTYWYVHDRLGSVRQVLDYHALTTVLEIAHSYGYTPFGQLDAGLCYDDAGEPDNPFRFTGQWYDGEIGQYYLRARMYDPQLMRFTSRDPVRGKQQEPLTLHKYLYCLNDPIHKIDPTGKMTTGELLITQSINGAFYGGLGGAVEGLVVELLGWMNGEDFDWGNVAFKASTGAVCGALRAFAYAKVMGTAVRLLPYKLTLIDFALGVAQGVAQDLWKEKKGLAKVDSGIAMHNLMIDAMVEGMW
jgi:RHS repeat-associated protein